MYVTPACPNGIPSGEIDPRGNSLLTAHLLHPAGDCTANQGEDEHHDAEGRDRILKTPSLGLIHRIDLADAKTKRHT
jgi:hypothetical protein